MARLHVNMNGSDEFHFQHRMTDTSPEAEESSSESQAWLEAMEELTEAKQRFQEQRQKETNQIEPLLSRLKNRKQRERLPGVKPEVMARIERFLKEHCIVWVPRGEKDMTDLKERKSAIRTRLHEQKDLAQLSLKTFSTALKRHWRLAGATADQVAGMTQRCGAHYYCGVRLLHVVATTPTTTAPSVKSISPQRRDCACACAGGSRQPTEQDANDYSRRLLKVLLGRGGDIPSNGSTGSTWIPIGGCCGTLPICGEVCLNAASVKCMTPRLPIGFSGAGAGRHCARSGTMIPNW